MQYHSVDIISIHRNAGMKREIVLVVFLQSDMVPIWTIFKWTNFAQVRDERRKSKKEKERKKAEMNIRWLES